MNNIFKVILSVTFIFSISFFSSCKKKVAYDPLNYDRLLYVKEEVPPPPKYYIFKASIGDKVVDTRGTATVLGDTLVISAEIDGKIFKISIAHFNLYPSYLIGHQQDSVSLSINGASIYEYASISGSDGKVNVTRLDPTNNQIEGSFNMNILNDNNDTLKISNGYFKINYSPNAVEWREKLDGEVLVADSIITYTNNSNIELNAIDTTTHHKLKLIFPNNIKDALFLLNIPYEINKKVYAYLQIPGEAELTAVAGVGSITLLSNTNNVVRGKFNSVKFITKANKKYTLNGTFSSEY